MNAKTNTESNAQVTIVGLLNGLHAERDQRLEANDSPRLGVHVVDHAVRLVRGCGLLLHVRCLASRDAPDHDGPRGGVIASMLILTFELQYPFRGDNGISPAV